MSKPIDDKPLISVLLPVFNGMPYLPESINSLLDQSEQRFIIIAVDDGSTDGSVDYLRSVRDPRLRLITANHSGLVGTLNKALGEAGTRYVARMDADDICSNTRFEEQLRFLENHSDIVLVGCSADHIGERGGEGSWPIKMPTDHQDIVRAMLRRNSAIIHPTIMARLAALQSAGEYSQKAWPAEDYELFLRLGLHGKLANLSERLYSIRLHGSSITSSSIIFGQRQYEKVRREYISMYSISGSKKSECGRAFEPLRSVSLTFDAWSVFLYRRGLKCMVNGEGGRGRLFLMSSAFLSPRRTITYMRRRLTEV